MLNGDEEEGGFSLSYDMVALGVFTSIYSAIQARNGLQQSLSVLNLYQKYEQVDGPRESCVGVLALLDIFVNIVMPIVVVFAGFLVVAVQDNYIEGVLNCAALLCKYLFGSTSKICPKVAWTCKMSLPLRFCLATADFRIFHEQSFPRLMMNFLPTSIGKQKK